MRRGGGFNRFARPSRDAAAQVSGTAQGAFEARHVALSPRTSRPDALAVASAPTLGVAAAPRTPSTEREHVRRSADAAGAAIASARGVRPASGPRAVSRLLVVDPAAEAFEATEASGLERFFRGEDLLVVNDAATLPASLWLQRQDGTRLEARLCGHAGGGRWRAALLGAGSWRMDTNVRSRPPRLEPDERLRVDGDATATLIRVDPLSPRLVELELGADLMESLNLIYRHGRPIQYSYLDNEVPLWDVQNTYAAAPSAFEMASAGRPLTGAQLVSLLRRGVRLATVTHAAGLSSTGDAAIDGALPLPERYVIPERTVREVADARGRGGRVVAVGTSTVRALEGCAQRTGALTPGEGETGLRLSAGFQPRIVSGLLSGVHGPGETHFDLLSAWAPPALLAQAHQHAARSGFLGHEFGDAALVLRGALEPL